MPELVPEHIGVEDERRYLDYSLMTNIAPIPTCCCPKYVAPIIARFPSGFYILNPRFFSQPISQALGAIFSREAYITTSGTL